MAEENKTIDKIYNEYKDELLNGGEQRYRSDSVYLFCLFYFIAGLAGAFFGVLISPFEELEAKDIAPLLTVIGAAIVSLLVAEQNKENEINKHREKWCSDLRNHFSEFSSVVNAFSKKYQAGIYDRSLSNKVLVEKLAHNLKESNEELKEVVRVHHMLALYLVSGEKEDPKNKIFDDVECLVNELHVRSDYIINYYDKWSGVDFHASHRRRAIQSRFNLLNNLAYNDLPKINYFVKIYLDVEWDKIKNNQYRDSQKRNLLYCGLIFLIFVFVGFLFG